MGQLFFQEQFNNHGINPSWYFPDARVNYNSPTHRYVYTIQSGFPYCSYIRIDQDSSHHNSRLVKYQQCITLQCQHAVVVDTINNDYRYSRSKKEYLSYDDFWGQTNRYWCLHFVTESDKLLFDLTFSNDVCEFIDVFPEHQDCVIRKF